MPVSSPLTKTVSTFSPQNIAGLNMWLDASDANTMFTNIAATIPVSTNGASIAAWKDKSSNQYLFTQSTGGTQPTYTTNGQNGLSVSSWSGSQFLQSSTTLPFYTSASSGGSFFVVFQATTVATQRFLMYYQNSPSGDYCTGSTEFGYTTGSGTPGNFGIHNGCGNAAVSLAQMTANTYTLMNLNLATTGTNPTNTTIYKNGTAQSVQSNGSGFYSAGSYPSGNNSRYLMIGARNMFGYSGPESFHSGTIAELLWFNSPVTSTQQQQIEGYLANKWGLQSALPARHPYTTNYRTTLSGLVWKDKSSAANNMTLISGNPVYSETAMSLNIPSGTVLQTTNYLTVAANVTGFFIVCQATSLSTSGWGTVLACPDINSGDSAVRFYPNTTTLSDGFVGTTFFVNGASYTSGNDTLRTGYNIIYAMPTSQSGSTRLSLSTSYLSRYFIGNIKEVLVYTSAITATERQQVETYLSGKWNIAVATAVGGVTVPTSITGCSLWLDGSDASTFITQSFVPTSISGCSFWLDGADINSMTLSGSSVTQWNDKSGNGYNATVASGKTAGTYSSAYKAINFPATTTGYVTSYPANPTTETMFVVANNPSPSGNNNVVIGGQQGARSLGFGFSGANGSSSACAYLNNQVTWCATTAPGSYTAGTTAIVSGYVSGGSSFISINGGSFSAAGTASFYSGTTTYLGVDTVLASFYFIGYVMEVIFYNSVLSPTQIAQVNTYLQQKWNTTLLVTGRPPPFVSRPFIPSDLPSCIIWLDGADGTSYSNSGSAITNWVNKGTGGGTTTINTGTLTPTIINRLNAVTFGAGASIRFPSLTFTSTSCSMFFVTNPSIVNSSVFTTFFAQTNADTIPRAGSIYQNQINTAYNANFFFSATAPTTPPSVASGVTSIICIIAGSPNYGVFTNGTSQTIINGSNKNYLTGTTTNMNYGDGGSVAHTCCEALMFDGALTDAQRNQVEAYLAWKWGLPNSLPTTHPGYKLPAFTAIFTPKSIGNLSLWLDAADRTTVSLSGSIVSAWYDKSGNENNATPPIAGPSYNAASKNGMGTLSFNGTSAFLNSPCTINTASHSLFVVHNPVNVNTNSTANDTRILSFQGTAPSFIIFPYNYGQRQGYSNGYFTPSTVNMPEGDVAGVYQVICANIQSGSSAVYNNGTVVSTSASAITTAVSNTLSIGAYGLVPSQQQYYYGSIAEIIIYNSVLTTSERQQVEGYLAWKWGLNSSLPSTHPYYKFSS